MIPLKEHFVKNKGAESIRLIFFGTPEFALASLKELIHSDFRPAAVVTAPDKPVGRKQIITPPPIKELAQKHKISVLQPEKIKDLEFIKKIKELKPDLIVVAAYGKILPKEILDIPRWGCLNVHPSLLPKYRGASPIQTAILNGEKETGVTIFKMTEGMDEGPIISQKSIPMEPNENAISLHEKLSELAVNLLILAMEKWITFNLMPEKVKDFFQLQEQNHQLASYTKILTKQDGAIIWNKSAQELVRQIRAFIPWPGSFCTLPNGKKLKILKARVAPDTSSEIQNQIHLHIKKPLVRQYGQVFLTKANELAVQTGQGALIIEELQLEGKKPTGSQEFLNGYPEIIDNILR